MFVMFLEKPQLAFSIFLRSAGSAWAAEWGLSSRCAPKVHVRSGGGTL